MFRLSTSGLLIAVVVSGGFFKNSLQRSTPDSDSYVAAVLEYNPVVGATAFAKNVENYLKFVTEAANKSADIIVFPEMTIRGSSAFLVPNPGDKVKLCNLQNHIYDEFLVKLSCAAFQSSIYLVLNIEEKFDCTSLEDDICKEAVEYIFNTNIVFDRDGTLVDRYRKINLFGEFGKTPSIDRALGVFDTDFGVKFAHFICFDLLFRVPAVEVLDKEKVKNVIFPTMWFSELPYLTAVQIQEGYAYANDINFLAAGANYPAVGSTGSGIYSGKAGAIVSIMSGVRQSRLLVARVPKIPGNVVTNEDAHIRPNSAAEMDGLLLKQDGVEVYRSQLIEEVTKAQVINLSYGDTECTFEIKLAEVTPNETKENLSRAKYIYRAVIFNGVQMHGPRNLGEINCAVVACTGQGLTSCGKRFAAHTEVVPSHHFTRISVVALIPASLRTKYRGVSFRPSTVLSSMIQLSPKLYSFHTSDRLDGSDLSSAVIATNTSILDLFTFGLYARDFANDDHPPTRLSAAKSTKLHISVFLFTLVLNLTMSSW